MKLPPNKLFHCFQQLFLIKKVIIIMKLEFQAIDAIVAATITYNGSTTTQTTLVSMAWALAVGIPTEKGAMAIRGSRNKKRDMAVAMVMVANAKVFGKETNK